MLPWYDVAIVGFGPCGAVAAALLGEHGIKTWVCDKSVEIYDKPRAFALDHEIMRVFQQLGIHDQVLAHAEPFTPSEFYGVKGQLIKRFTSVAPPYPLAFAPSLVFNQPATERILRRYVATLPSVHVALGSAVVGLTQNAEKVELLVRSETGQPTRIGARYAIACDGASSTLRGLTDITLEDLGFDQPWLVVDVLVNQQGARKLPQVSIQYCEPARPTTYLVGPGQHRRWEISINPDDDAQELATPEGTWKLLSRWITPRDATLWRQASYRFHALVARHWRAGRVFVAGDAAHQQPPFLGQGMCQGIRDVVNLCWKLDAVLRAGAADVLLDSYGVERKAHVQALTSRIKNIGLLIGERNPAAAAARDAQLLAQCGGVVKSVARQDVQPALSAGLLAPQTNAAVGTIFPQPWLNTDAGLRRMDGVAGRGWRVVLKQHAAVEFSRVCGALKAIHVVAIGTGDYQDADGIAPTWFAKHGCSAAVVRPDHYVYGVASSPDQLATQLQTLQQRLYQGDSHVTSDIS